MFQLGVDNFRKPHAFDMRNGVPVFVGEEKAGIGGRSVLILHLVSPH